MFGFNLFADPPFATLKDVEIISHVWRNICPDVADWQGQGTNVAVWANIAAETPVYASIAPEDTLWANQAAPDTDWQKQDKDIIPVSICNK